MAILTSGPHLILALPDLDPVLSLPELGKPAQSLDMLLCRYCQTGKRHNDYDRNNGARDGHLDPLSVLSVFGVPSVMRHTRFRNDIPDPTPALPNFDIVAVCKQLRFGDSGDIIRQVECASRSVYATSLSDKVEFVLLHAHPPDQAGAPSRLSVTYGPAADQR